MKTENYLGMIAHIAPPPHKTTPPPSCDEGGLFSLLRRCMHRLNGWVMELLHVAVFVHNALDVGGGETAIDLVANHGNRGQTASAHATQTGQRELAVGSGLTHLEVKLILEGIQNLLGTTHVAGRTQAYADRVLALRGHGEECVE